jgi:hypothetical protein
MGQPFLVCHFSYDSSTEQYFDFVFCTFRHLPEFLLAWPDTWVHIPLHALLYSYPLHIDHLLTRQRNLCYEIGSFGDRTLALKLASCRRIPFALRHHHREVLVLAAPPKMPFLLLVFRILNLSFGFINVVNNFLIL